MEVFKFCANINNYITEYVKYASVIIWRFPSCLHLLYVQEFSVLEVVQWILTVKYFPIRHIAFNEFNLLKVNIVIRGRKDLSYAA